MPIIGSIKGTDKFPVQKREIFRKFKEIGGIAGRFTPVRRTSDSAPTRHVFNVIDADLSRSRRGIAENGHLWTEASLVSIRDLFKVLLSVQFINVDFFRWARPHKGLR